MQQRPLVTLIIPVYQVEAYLVSCLESILPQWRKADELLVIDDGTRDGSAVLGEDYVLTFSNLSLIHRANGGLSAARNTGMALAHGKYFMFADSDDGWNPSVSFADMLATVTSQPEVECWLFPWLDYFPGDGYYQRREHRLFSHINLQDGLSFYQSLLAHGSLEVSACAKIVRRDFLQQWELCFREGMRGEDNEWMVRLLRHLKRPGVLLQPLYVYRQRPGGSISSSIGFANVRDLLQMIESSLNYHQQATPLRACEWSFCAYLWFVALGLAGANLNRHERYELRGLFERTREVLHYLKSPKARLAAFAYRLLGGTLTGKFLGWYIGYNDRRKPNRHKIPTPAWSSIF